MNDLNGEVAIVTGGATGLGQEIAITLANRGAMVISVSLEESTETIEKVAAHGGKCVGYCVDLTDDLAVKELFANIAAEYGRIDILVNNAGFYAVDRRPMWEIDLPEWEKVITVNIRSVFLCSKYATEMMRKARCGAIVNISSNVVTFGMPNLMHYVAAKGAVSAMTRAMANELGDFGVRVNSVAPGLVKTDTAVAELGEQAIQNVVDGTQSIKVMIEPGDVAEAVSFLAGPESRLISGQMLIVNGGGV